MDPAEGVVAVKRVLEPKVKKEGKAWPEKLCRTCTI
jgi:hypothetical protein